MYAYNGPDTMASETAADEFFRESIDPNAQSTKDFIAEWGEVGVEPGDSILNPQKIEALKALNEKQDPERGAMRYSQMLDAARKEK